jgi:hypothetical protein
MQTREVIRWGIIGCGDVTEVKSGPGFQKAAGSRLVAVMRRDATRAADYARRHAVPRWYADARALVADPAMILLDEPSMGLAPQIVEEIFGIVQDLNSKERVSFLLAEQQAMMNATRPQVMVAPVMYTQQPGLAVTTPGLPVAVAQPEMVQLPVK